MLEAPTILDIPEVPRENSITLLFETKNNELPIPGPLTPSISTRIHIYDPAGTEVTPVGGGIPTSEATGIWKYRFQSTAGHALGLYLESVATNHEGAINNSERRPAFRLKAT